jgi:hypothetical protein
MIAKPDLRLFLGKVCSYQHKKLAENQNMATFYVKTFGFEKMIKILRRNDFRIKH